jgi:hypothetical protein
MTVEKEAEGRRLFSWLRRAVMVWGGIRTAATNKRRRRSCWTAFASTPSWEKTNPGSRTKPREFAQIKDPPAFLPAGLEKFRMSVSNYVL